MDHNPSNGRGKDRAFFLRAETILNSEWDHRHKLFMFCIWFRNDTDWAFPNRETLARYLSCAPRTVSKIIRDLTAAGAIEVRRDRGQMKRGNRYRVCFRPSDGADSCTIPPPRDAGKRGSHVQHDAADDCTLKAHRPAHWKGQSGASGTPSENTKSIPPVNSGTGGTDLPWKSLSKKDLKEAVNQHPQRLRMLYRETVDAFDLTDTDVTEHQFFAAAHNAVHDSKVKNAAAVFVHKVKNRDWTIGENGSDDWASDTIRELDGRNQPRVSNLQEPEPDTQREAERQTRELRELTRKQNRSGNNPAERSPPDTSKS